VLRRLLDCPAAAGRTVLAARRRRPAAQAPTVAAAANVKPAIEELAALFERQPGRHKLRLVFGSSGNFVAQILQGAPFHLFVSADEDTVFRLADAGRTEDRGRVYAQGRLVLLAPRGSPLKVDAELKDLAAALRDGRVSKLAIANPEHAPYGMRAREALQHAGLWELAQPRLVIAENVSQAVQFAMSGSAQGGFVAYSLALVPAVAAVGEHVLVPASFHAPLAQRMALDQGRTAGGAGLPRLPAHAGRPGRVAAPRLLGAGRLNRAARRHDRLAGARPEPGAGGGDAAGAAAAGPVGWAAGWPQPWRGKAWIEALVVLPLVLPPTVLGYYLLVAFGAASPLGAGVQRPRPAAHLQLRGWCWPR
jgi:molybdate transport system substrate-binding protein